MNRKNPYVTRRATEYDLTILSLSHYELECYFFYGKTEPLLYVWDCKNTEYNVVGDFFRFNWDAEDINEYLIPDIEKLIARGIGDEVFASELVSALVEADYTYFSSKSDLTNAKNDCRESTVNLIETHSFLKIAKLWHCFLVLSEHRPSLSLG